MPQTCIVCKTNPATVSARVANKETGEFSPPVPLCEECLNKVSKTRKVEIVSDHAPAPAPIPKPVDPVPINAAPVSDNLTKKKSHLTKIAAVIVILAGIACIIAGLIIKVPNSHLVDVLDSNPYMLYNGIQFRPGYSSVERIVGGDAYNYIIGASLVGGYISGRIVQKTIFIVGGIIISLAGFVALCVLSDRQK